MIACTDCIEDAKVKNLDNVACPHMPKLSFSNQLSALFTSHLKDRVVINVKNTTHYTTAFACLHRALGRHVEADDVEDRLYVHQEKLVSHHYRVAAFLSMRAELQHTSKHGRGRALAKYDNDNDVERCSRDLIQSISMDAESGSRTPSCRVSFAYFSRVLY